MAKLEQLDRAAQRKSTFLGLPARKVPIQDRHADAESGAAEVLVAPGILGFNRRKKLAL